MKPGFFLGPPTLSAIVLAILTLLAGCGDDSDGEQPLAGRVRIDGSSTVYPITTDVAEEFATVEPDIDLDVATSSTSRGFELLCNGGIEISNASRSIERDEIAECENENVRDLVEVQVGVDALTVAVHPNNSFVNCLTLQQLFDIFTGLATSWNEVDPSFPDQEIALVYPDPGSGSFEYFVDQVIEYIDEVATHVHTGVDSEDDVTLAENIAADESAIGYLGFTRYRDSPEALKAVHVDDGDGCVSPSIESAFDRTYYLSRPLFIYTREAHLNRDDSPVQAFVNFYMENTVGFVPSFRHVSDS